MSQKNLPTNSYTLGIVAPASYESPKLVYNKLKNIRSLGFNIKISKNLFKKSSIFAGTAKERAKDILDMFTDESIDGILCLRGGYGSVHTLPYLDKNIILNNPKFFCGYSDITVLLNYFASIGLISFHGPMLTSNFNDKSTITSFKNIIYSNNSTIEYSLNKYKTISYINIRSFSGKLIGGNLTMICSIIGTPYEIKNDSEFILFLEEVNEAPYCLHRLLSQLILSNFINENCKGIIIGYLSNVQPYTLSIDKQLLESIIIELLEPLNIPLLIGFPSGHNYPNLTLPIGCNATFDSLTQKLIFELRRKS